MDSQVVVEQHTIKQLARSFEAMARILNEMLATGATSTARLATMAAHGTIASEQIGVLLDAPSLARVVRVARPAGAD